MGHMFFVFFVMLRVGVGGFFPFLIHYDPCQDKCFLVVDSDDDAAGSTADTQMDDAEILRAETLELPGLDGDGTPVRPQFTPEEVEEIEKFSDRQVLTSPVESPSPAPSVATSLAATSQASERHAMTAVKGTPAKPLHPGGISELAAMHAQYAALQAQMLLMEKKLKDQEVATTPVKQNAVFSPEPGNHGVAVPKVPVGPTFKPPPPPPKAAAAPTAPVPTAPAPDAVMPAEAPAPEEVMPTVAPGEEDLHNTFDLSPEAGQFFCVYFFVLRCRLMQPIAGLIATRIIHAS